MGKVSSCQIKFKRLNRQGHGKVRRKRRPNWRQGLGLRSVGRVFEQFVEKPWRDEIILPEGCKLVTDL